MFLERGPSFQHLLFVDDYLIFKREHFAHVATLLLLIRIFKECSGQRTEVVGALFQALMARAILSVHLPMDRRPDRLVWRMEHHGRFTVRSAYNFLLDLDSHQASTDARDMGFYRMLWSQPFPEKIQIFIWQAFLLPHLSMSDTNKFFLLLRSIWGARNRQLYQGHLSSDVEIHWFLNNYLLDLSSASVLSDVVVAPVVRVWSPPTSGFIKANVDGSFDRGLGLGGIGCVFRNSAGGFLVGSSRVILHAMDAFHVEALTCLEGLYLALRLAIGELC
ncbi:hypothetical protein F3Y22_tig00113725pilonHSYRG01685 [Hibiscus syriacus]|uniref:RNase H type-1 domain-containing protein n=1 Tax=Hibiscus syriacus TaxID=106335 RepID=A0A6A2WND4_HIBSY|nr:hypothetical protein F3Y22_tig00113725pilonHSYRG01685 [Hibiscus syriacus]